MRIPDADRCWRAIRPGNQPVVIQLLVRVSLSCRRDCQALHFMLVDQRLDEA